MRKHELAVNLCGSIPADCRPVAPYACVNVYARLSVGMIIPFRFYQILSIPRLEQQCTIQCTSKYTNVAVCVHMFDLETTDSVVPRSRKSVEAGFGPVAEIHTTNRVKRNMKRSGSCFLAVACYSLLFRPYLG